MTVRAYAQGGTAAVKKFAAELEDWDAGAKVAPIREMPKPAEAQPGSVLMVNRLEALGKTHADQFFAIRAYRARNVKLHVWELGPDVVVTESEEAFRWLAGGGPNPFAKVEAKAKKSKAKPEPESSPSPKANAQQEGADAELVAERKPSAAQAAADEALKRMLGK